MSTKIASVVGIALTALAATYGLQGMLPAEAGSSSKLGTLYGGPKGFAVLKNPERIEAFRLSHVAGEEPVVTAGPIKVEQPTSQQIVSLLSADKSFDWNLGKGCIPIWGVRLSFYRGTDRLDVLLCFQCDILGVSLNGKELKFEDFDPVHAQLVKIVKVIFPDDPEIQKLSEES